MSDARDALMASGFEEATESGGMPVLRARGTFAGMDVKMQDSRDDEVDPDTGTRKQFARVIHKVLDLDVLEVKEGTEFPFESMEVPISPKNKEGTAWFEWIASIGTALGIDLDEVGADGKKVWASYAKLYDELLDGKSAEFDHTKSIPIRRMNKKNEWYNGKQFVWRVTSIGGSTTGSGAPTATPTEAAIALVGSTNSLMEFVQAVPRSSVIATDEQLLLKLASDATTWLSEQLTAGTLAQEGDWYTVVG